MKLGILGGGLTGLTLGYLLGKNSEVLEKNPETGGLCRSLFEEGFTFDYSGSHIIFSKDAKVMDFMLSILGKNTVRNRRNTKILFKDKLVKYPFENGLADLPTQDNFECLYSYIDNLLRRERGEVQKPKNFREWIYYMFGKGIAENYMIPYNEKIWNTKAEEMGLEWIEGRVPQPPVEDVIKSSLGIPTEGYTHQLYFYYPKNGGMQALTDSIEANGKAKITKNFEIKSVRKEGKSWVVLNGKENKIFDKLVSTIPLFDLVKALPEVPEDVVTAVKGLKYTSLVTVMVGIDNPKINDISWLYVPDPKVDPNRVSFPSNFSPNVAPKGKSAVLAEITCSESDQVWKQKDASIAEETIDELHSLKLLDKREVCYSSVRKTKYAYIIYDLDYTKNMGTIRHYFDGLGISLCGRFSEFKYMNMDACISSAMNTARSFGWAHGE